MNYFWQPVNPAVIVPRYDMLKSISYDIYLGQDLNFGQDLGQNLHPPNISWIHNVKKTRLFDVLSSSSINTQMKQILPKL